MFQHGVDFNRIFTVGLSHWGGTPSNSIRLRKSSANIAIILKRNEENARKVCLTLKIYVNYARLGLGNGKNVP